MSQSTPSGDSQGTDTSKDTQGTEVSELEEATILEPIIITQEELNKKSTYEPSVSKLDMTCVDFTQSVVSFGLDSSDEGSEDDEDLSKLEYTLAFIKPNAMDFKREIVRRIKDEGFIIIKEGVFNFTPETASDFYEEHYGKLWFPKIILKICKGPVFAMCLAKQNAIADFKYLMGPPKVSTARQLFPKSLRALYGLKGDMATNGIHGSNSKETAEREVHFFFKDVKILQVHDIDSDIDFLKKELRIILSKGLMALYKERPNDPVRWLADWLLLNNPKKANMTVPIMRMPSLNVKTGVFSTFVNE